MKSIDFNPETIEILSLFGKKEKPIEEVKKIAKKYAAWATSEDIKAL